MNFEQAQNFLYSLNNLPRNEYMRDPRHCGVYLERLQYFLDMIGNPEKKIKHYVHATGTNGKGSVCTMLHSILQAGGNKVGLLTSPHIERITDRWRVGNRDMSEKDFARIVTLLKQKLDQYLKKSPYDMLSYHELTTAIGLYYFAEQSVDWAVIEVGCGGRYDSTNVLPWKDAAVITNIGLEHKKTLGATKSLIGIEKAGIIKKGCKAFTMESLPRIRKILAAEAKKVQASFRYVEPDFEIVSQEIGTTIYRYDDEEFELGLLGSHQIKNAVLATQVAQGLGISLATIKKGLKKVTLRNRMELVDEKPLYIFDTAHNKYKIASSVETLLSFPELAEKKIHLLVGLSADKDTDAIVRELAKLKLSSVVCTRNTVNQFRKVAGPNKLAELFKEKFGKKTKVETFLDPAEALVWSQQQAKKNDLIFVTGSVFVTGEVRNLLQ